MATRRARQIQDQDVLTALDPEPSLPQPTPAEGANMAAGLVPTAATALLLVLLALAILRPELSLFWAPIVAAGVACAGWWYERANNAQIRRRDLWLGSESARQAAEIERLSDAAWELREREERYRNLIDAQGDLVVRRDPQGEVTFLNPAFRDTFGWDRSPALGGRLEFGPAWRAAANGAEAQDLHLETVNGPRWFSWIDIPMRDENGDFGSLYSVARDITARKESEQALEEARRKAEEGNRAKSHLLATVSHEFRTPLNGILGLAKLLDETGLTAPQKSYAAGIQTSGQTLLALVDDMLDFSRIEAGRLELHPEPVDLEHLVGEIVELLAVRAHYKGIEIAADVAPGLPNVLVDPVRLRQILTNLAGNGVKFTEAGGVTITVSGAQAADGQMKIDFTVGDTGPGVAADDAERIFGEFERSDEALDRRHGGAGLGLAICRRLVRHLGAELSLVSSPGAGAEFIFSLTLPIAPTSDDAKSADETFDVAGRRVLILSESSVESAILARQLEAAGGEAKVVESSSSACGLAAAAVAAGQGYHAVLIDEQMAASPDLLADLRDAAGTRLPAAVLIQPRERPQVDDLIQEGFDAYLMRPTRRRSLLRVVDAMASGEGFCADPRDELDNAEEGFVPQRGAQNLLLAEDNEINALLARAVAERAGYRVTEVRNGRDAVAACVEGSAGFSAILMDLHMPEKDGLTASREIRAAEMAEGRPPVPIIALTADVLPETRDAALAAGVTQIVTKPLTPEALRDALAEALGESVSRAVG